MHEQLKQQQTKWFEANAFRLYDFCYRQYRSLDTQQIVLSLLRKIHAGFCPAETETTFLIWAQEQFQRAVCNLHLWEQRKELSVQEVVQWAAMRTHRKNEPPFVSEIHGDRAFIQIMHRGQQHVWVVPAYWLPVAQALWPVHVRRNRKSGPYVSKTCTRQLRNGATQSVEIPVHELYMGADHGERIVAKDGSFLNYLIGNLEIECDHDLFERNLTNPDAPMDAAPIIDNRDTQDWVPAQSTKVPMRQEDRPAPRERRAAPPTMSPVDHQVKAIREAWGIRTGRKSETENFPNAFNGLSEKAA